MKTSFLAKGAVVALAVVVGSCASKRGGPTPEITGVMPDLICTAQSDQVILIEGSGFAPAAIKGLKDTPKVAMPRVFLVAEDGTETEIPPANVSLPDGDTSGTLLQVIVPQGLVSPAGAGESEAIYDIRVENPNRNDGTLSDALTIVPPPELTAVAPNEGPAGLSITVTLTGTGFRDGMTVTLDANPAVMASDANPAVMASDVVVASSTPVPTALP